QFFFFSSRRRHTRSYGDWSSDVCSSDLDVTAALANGAAERHASLYASGLDAIATYLQSSSFDAQRPWRETTAHKRRKLEVALARSEERRVGKECRTRTWAWQ